jgi:hypothetical protein
VINKKRPDDMEQNEKVYINSLLNTVSELVKEINRTNGISDPDFLHLERRNRHAILYFNPDTSLRFVFAFYPDKSRLKRRSCCYEKGKN